MKDLVKIVCNKGVITKGRGWLSVLVSHIPWKNSPLFQNVEKQGGVFQSSQMTSKLGQMFKAKIKVCSVFLAKKSRLRREKMVFYVLRHDFTLLKIAQIHTNMHVSGNRGSTATYIIQNNNVYTNYTTISTYTSHINSRRRRAKILGPCTILMPWWHCKKSLSACLNLKIFRAPSARRYPRSWIRISSMTRLKNSPLFQNVEKQGGGSFSKGGFHGIGLMGPCGWDPLPKSRNRVSRERTTGNILGFYWMSAKPMATFSTPVRFVIVI